MIDTRLKLEILELKDGPGSSKRDASNRTGVQSILQKSQIWMGAISKVQRKE